MGFDVDAELDRQLAVLVDKGYPVIAGLQVNELEALTEPVRDALRGRVVDDGGPTTSSLPFVLVVTRAVVPTEQAMALTTLAGRNRPGVVDRNHAPGDLDGYLPIDAVRLPDARCYAVLGFERGEELCGVRPQEALPVVLGRGRTPLTIDEGVAIVTLFPEVLEKNRCFMLSGSRRHDRRVPAMWIGAGAPKLGWCWDGNPHSWLGTASVADRVA
jgi:hypothetical protein